MTRAQAEAAIGQRVRVEGGSYDGREFYINEVHRKLAYLACSRGGVVVTGLSPFRLHLIEEEETP